jgi:hypothetical protein
MVLLSLDGGLEEEAPLVGAVVGIDGTEDEDEDVDADVGGIDTEVDDEVEIDEVEIDLVDRVDEADEADEAGPFRILTTEGLAVTPALN